MVMVSLVHCDLAVLVCHYKPPGNEMAVLAIAGGKRLPKRKFPVQKAGEGVDFASIMIVSAVCEIQLAAAVCFAVVNFVPVRLPHFEAVPRHLPTRGSFLQGGGSGFYRIFDFKISPNRFHGHAARRRCQDLIAFVQRRQVWQYVGVYLVSVHQRDAADLGQNHREFPSKLQLHL